MSKASVVIHALNEEEPIAGVVRECLATGVPAEVIVVDNGSTDHTAAQAYATRARQYEFPASFVRANCRMDSPLTLRRSLQRHVSVSRYPPRRAGETWDA